MKISRRAFLLTAAAAACSRHDGAAPLQRAVDYLWGQQAEDGGFHSANYGLLRSGQSLTPFVLNALLSVPDSLIRPRPAGLDRAFVFLERNTNEGGEIGRMDETAADYPNYATSLAVTAMVKARRAVSSPDIERMIGHLRAQQFSEAGDWKPADAPYGAWGMGGPIHRRPDTASTCR